MSSTQPPDHRPRVVVSILNWNGARETIACVRSLLACRPETMTLRVVVVDNGSRADDREALEAGLHDAGVQLIRLDRNTGFAGGHNVVIREALEDGSDYIWLLNNDTLVSEGALATLVAFMQRDPGCGAASPVIRALHDAQLMDFCGAVHDWPALTSHRPNRVEEAQRLESEHPQDMWLHGTALLLRIAALRDSGMLEEDYFAYYEDDDLGARLSRAGWRNRVCFESEVRHMRRVAPQVERPAYFFYLMARNSLLFWHRHAGGRDRRRLRSRLVARSLIEAAKLNALDMPEKRDACLVGAAHGLGNRAGPPAYDAPPPLWLRLASRLPYRLLHRLS